MQDFDELDVLMDQNLIEFTELGLRPPQQFEVSQNATLKIF